MMSEKNIYFTKKEIEFIEQLIDKHIEMYESDAKGDDDIKADLINAECIHYKILKHNSRIDKFNRKWYSKGLF